MQALIYARTADRDRCEQWAQNHGLLPHFFLEDRGPRGGVDLGLDRRTNLRSCIQAAGRGDTVLIVSLSDIHPSTLGRASFISLLRDRGSKLVALEPSPEDAAAEATADYLSGHAYQLRALRPARRWMRAIFGYREGRDGLEPRPRQIQLVGLIQALFAAGAAAEAINEILLAKEITPAQFGIDRETWTTTWLVRRRDTGLPDRFSLMPTYRGILDAYNADPTMITHNAAEDPVPEHEPRG